MAKSETATKRLVVVDISNFIFRAFFAIRSLNAPDGTPVNALYGVLGMLQKILSKYRPTHIFLARDTSSGSFRNELFDAYKANRVEPPEELIPQFGLIEELINKMELPNFSHQNYEADDIIGSAVTQWKDYFDEILIASGDKDLMQFVDGKVKMVDTMKEKIYDENEVYQKMGVWPHQIVDYLSMVGDSSDNIPGMKGIGAKGAAKLLEEYGSFDNCVKAKDQLKGKKLVEAFSEHLEDGYLSRKLVTIVTDMDLGFKPETTSYKFYPSDELLKWLEQMGFKSQVLKLMDLRKSVVLAEKTNQVADQSFLSMSLGDQAPVTECIELPEAELEKIKSLLENTEQVAFLSFYDSADVHQRNLVKAALSTDNKTAYYFNFENWDEKNKLKLLSWLWANDQLELLSTDIKSDYIYARRMDIAYNAKQFDITQVHFILLPDSNHTLSYLVKDLLGFEIVELEKGEKSVLDLSSEKARLYAGQRAACVLSLAKRFKEELKHKQLEKVYYELDCLLTPALAKMEMAGVCLNPDYFQELAAELEQKLSAIETKVASFCQGTDVNLNSPKQVAQLLFETLKLPTIKQTKTGQSTDSEVLEELDGMNLSPVPGLILQYREIGKILSTYVRVLPGMVNAKTNRLHTTFTQHVAATGRLSSINPNLQNIPIRSDLGRKVRRGFIACPGTILLGADYSQVELRILAHFSGDPSMRSAFESGIDIHARTASEVLGVDINNITPDERAKAKAVNFGLMYGQSSFGLAKVLGISRGEAKDYITKYFQRFGKVKTYLDTLKEECEKTGYAQTLFGRKRYLPDIHSQNRTVKAMAERLAVNSPIQGTAADIIKLAMIKIDQDITAQGLRSKMLLQVHDELIFEVPEDELEQMKQLVIDGMEKVVNLDIPLKVDVGVGVSWYDLK